MSTSRRIVITGGSNGIGQAIARRLSASDTHIVNVDVADGGETESMCSGPVHTLSADLGDP